MARRIVPLNPRRKINRSWDSRGLAEGADYGRLLLEDLKVRKFIVETLPEAAISKVVIERPAKQCRVSIYCARPRAILAREGMGTEELTEILRTLVSADLSVQIIEIARPQLDAKLVAQYVAALLERGVGSRRAMKRAVQSALRLGAEGIRINCVRRLGRAEITRWEWYREGRVPLHTLRANIDHAEAEAHTASGVCGVKVWIFRGEILGYDPMATNAHPRSAPLDTAMEMDSDSLFSTEGIRATFRGALNLDAGEAVSAHDPDAAPSNVARELGDESDDPFSAERLRGVFRGRS